jgi:GNAT superfamily N-acetyltransferase
MIDLPTPPTLVPPSSGEPDDRPLDNPVWWALTGPQAAFGTVQGGAAVFDADVCPFGTVDDVKSAEAWHDLARLVGDRMVALPGVEVEAIPAGWELVEHIPCLQMVGDSFPASHPLDEIPSGTDLPIEHLSGGDTPAMLALIRRTEPGPFLGRTVELGHYAGIRHPADRRSLVAMCGERLGTGAWRELSAVCTEPAFRGRGYAAALIDAARSRMQNEGVKPFLHVRIGNPAARLYEALGFSTRREFDFVVIRRR